MGLSGVGFLVAQGSKTPPCPPQGGNSDFETYDDFFDHPERQIPPLRGDEFTSRCTTMTPLFMLTQETEFLFDAKALISLLFYMGYLTVAERRGTRIYFKMPNLALESLYLDYMQHLLMRRAQIRIDDIQRDEMISDLLEGKIDLLIELTEKLLKGLSNRDYQRFDEKYIKVVMLSQVLDL